MDLIWKPYDIPTPETEYRFHPTRKWRFDYAWIKEKIAVEVEGGIWSGGRHTRGSGFAKDMEKYNQAGYHGWRVFRFTPSEIKKGVAQTCMRKVFEDADSRQ